MIKPCYINGMSCISAQNTFDNQFFEPQLYQNPIFSAKHPSYKTFIKPMQLRRLSNAVKMGLTTAKAALENAQVSTPNAIITSTGMGCRQDSVTFLNQLIENNEQFLSPTSFIQSTHNTIGGQIALHLGCKTYNTTYVQSSASFEMALLDTLMTLGETSQVTNVLVGTVDEVAEYTNLYQDNEHLKKTMSEPTGSTMSEGASFFLCSNTQSNRTVAKVVSTTTALSLKENDVEGFVQEFLKKQSLQGDDIEGLILGTNGDQEFDSYYTSLKKSIQPRAQLLHYKHLSGEHNSASGFALWLACMIFKESYVPAYFKLDVANAVTPRSILIYNQYRGKNHSLMLVEAV